LEAEDSERSDNYLMKLVLGDIGLECISKQSILMQKYYLRWVLYIGLNTSVQQFVERLNIP
jgi:hypothetical protein